MHYAAIVPDRQELSDHIFELLRQKRRFHEGQSHYNVAFKVPDDFTGAIWPGESLGCFYIPMHTLYQYGLVLVTGQIEDLSERVRAVRISFVRHVPGCEPRYAGTIREADLGLVMADDTWASCRPRIGTQPTFDEQILAYMKHYE